MWVAAAPRIADKTYVPTAQTSPPAAKPNARPRAAKNGRRGWKFHVALAGALTLVLFCGLVSYFYVSFSRMIDARMHGEFQRTDPRIFARPFTVRRGQRITLLQTIDRLNELGYAQRPRAQMPGEFAIGRDALAVVPRAGERRGQTVRLVYAASKTGSGGLINIELFTKRQSLDSLALDAPLITALVSGEGREKRRDVPLAAIPSHIVRAVVAIEDRRFYDHPGIDIIGTTRAVLTNILGTRKYLSGGSTITQQLVRNTFLTQEKSLKRKFTEWFMSVALERRLTKDQILELYLNDVGLGQRGAFAIHGVPEAARLFFAKDVSNLNLVEAATIAGVIQAPPRYSPFTNPDRAKERRNVVLHAMQETGFISPDAEERAAREPVQIVARALESEAPYFVDYVSQELQERSKATGAVDVYTTLDLQLQRIAQDAMRDGLTRVDEILARRKRRNPQAALMAIDPRTGEILAMVGGRSYNQSQYNRAIVSRRQPGSTFKPFVYLTAFEQAALNGDTGITPATVVDDSPTTWEFDDQVWTPENYQNEYGGMVTYRDALAHSRNVATIKAAERAGYANVAKLWARLGVGSQPKPYPSIALGVFEATPLEMATAYTIFPNMGVEKKLRHIMKVTSGESDVTIADNSEPKTIARPDTTFLVTDMLRTVINEGTGAGARSMGFTLDAAGKTGTTNDTRDAWFIGFTPELLTVVWVGY